MNTSATVHIAGELNRHVLPQVLDRLDDAVEAMPCELVVDLADCPSVDATALAALVETHRRVRSAGATLVLAHCSPRVLWLLSLTGLARVFDLRSPCTVEV